jgi:CRP-like cAMP-binding protein
MTRTKEPQNFTNSPHMRTVRLPHTTGKKITRPGKSIPNRRWNTPIKLTSGRKKLIASPYSQRGRCNRMKRVNRRASRLKGFSSGGASLGGKVSRYRNKQKIYAQGAPAYTLFYIQEGGVRLTTKTKHQPAAVTAILGVHDFFGELCLAGYPLRMSTAVALTASSIRTIKKEKMLQMLRKKNKTSNSLVAYLLSSVKKYRDHVSELLTSSAEQRLARVLLRLSHLDKKGPPITEIPRISHQVLADMVGTTRQRVNLFMNRFRKRGFIDYDGGLEVHRSLRKVLRKN